MRPHLLRISLLLVGICVLALSGLYLQTALSFTPPGDVLAAGGRLEILDRNGKPLLDLQEGEESGRVLPLDQISPHLINATISTEDNDFWSNSGINLRGMARAVYENLAFWEHGGFFKGSGGSSVSQQLAKNLYFAPDDRTARSPMRKLKEAMLAFELNRRYSKDQILEWYLSHLFYGNNAYGVEAASYRYFSKPPSALTLNEAALLAGIPRAPAIYDPISNPDAAQARQREVIELMVRHGFLTEEEGVGAAEPVTLKEGAPPASSQGSIAPHFALYVRDLLPSLLSQSQLDGHLIVTTTLDSGMQSVANTAVAQQIAKIEPQVGATNGALVSMDPRSGEILALVGSRDFFRADINGQVNNATALNQPGSTIKPITYLAAFMKGWSPATIVKDEPIRVANGETSYTLGNADGRYRGSLSARNALGSSLNVPAVKALEYAGLPQVYSLAKKMGLSTLQDISNYGAAFTLGGVDVSLLDMTYAFSVFPNQGEQSGGASLTPAGQGNRALDPVAVLRIETADGKTLWEHRGRRERIVPENAAYLITNVLSDDNARVSMFGANSTLNLAGTAVKSGLSDNARDAWTVGYSPDLVTGVWVGNANNTPMPGATSSYAAAPIWRQFMQAAMQGRNTSGFTMPKDVQVVRVCAATGLLPGRSCSSTVNEVFLPGRAPTTTGEPALPSRPQATPTPDRRVTATPTPSRSNNGNDRSPSRLVTSTPASSSPRLEPTPRPTEDLEPPSTPRPRNNRNRNNDD